MTNVTLEISTLVVKPCCISNRGQELYFTEYYDRVAMAGTSLMNDILPSA